MSDYSCFEANGGQICVGFNNFFNTNCKITSLENIKIGDNNLFGPNVVILDHDHRYRNTSVLINQQGFEKSPVIIGSNVWICANVVVTRGVEIKDNIVVSANSVVKESLIVPGVYAGNPAKLVKEIA